MFDVWHNLFDKYRIPLEDFLEAFPHENPNDRWLERIEIDWTTLRVLLEFRAYEVYVPGNIPASDLYRLIDKYKVCFEEVLEFFPESIIMARVDIALGIGKKKYDRTTKYSDILEQELSLLKE